MGAERRSLWHRSLDLSTDEGPGRTLALVTADPRPERSTAWRAGFGGLLMAGMASATSLIASIGIVATFIIDDLGISRGMLGLLIAANAVVGALVSPRVGWVVDGLGGKRSLILVFATSAAAFVGMAASPVYLLMFVPILLGAAAQAGTNPATNKLIAELTPLGTRGLLTGLKQSGVQVGIFLAGVSLPALAGAVGWRWAFVIVAAVPTLAIPITGWFLPADAPDGREVERPADEGPLPPAIVVLAVYGALVGFGGSYTFLVPLFAEESLGYSPEIGGLAAGLTGLASVVGRIAWARWAEIDDRYFTALLVIAGLSVVAALSYGWAGWAAAPLLWVGALLTGLSSASWNSVGNLAVMATAGAERAGRASGVMAFGFLAGLGLGPPIYGWTVDVTGSYTSMWVIATAVLAAGAVVAALARRGTVRT